MNKFFAPLLIALGLASCTAENVAPDCLDRSHIVRGLNEYTMFVSLEYVEEAEEEFQLDLPGAIAHIPNVDLVGQVFEFTFTELGNVQASADTILTGAFAVQCESVNIDFDNDELGVISFEPQPNGDLTFVDADQVGGRSVFMEYVIIKN